MRLAGPGQRLTVHCRIQHDLTLLPGADEMPGDICTEAIKHSRHPDPVLWAGGGYQLIKVYLGPDRPMFTSG